MDESQLLVIRHVAPNHGIPPPKKHYPARRPSYRTTLDLRNGKDWEWSTIMAEIKMEMNPKIEDSEFNWENEDIVMKLVDEKGYVSLDLKQDLTMFYLFPGSFFDVFYTYLVYIYFHWRFP